jgi:uncharacterized protein (DUF2126 family)
MYLIPGDSPMGYRLPLDSLPWVSKNDFPYLIEQDPFAPRNALAGAAPLRSQTATRPANTKPQASSATANMAADVSSPQAQESAYWLTRTALCVEARDPMRANGPQAEKKYGGQSGVLYVFMPPLANLEDYLDLLHAVEETAVELEFQIVLEGYPPPRVHASKCCKSRPTQGD